MPLTLDDFVHHLNMPAPPPESDPRRVEMQRALGAAVGGIIRMTGMLDGSTVTARVTGRGGVLSLPYVRLASVGAVTDPAGLVATPASIDLEAGLLTVSATTSGTWLVVCTGEAWPDELSIAALDWATHMYDTQRARLSATTTDDSPAPSYSLPNRVEELVRPYRTGGVA